MVIYIILKRKIRNNVLLGFFFFYILSSFLTSAQKPRDDVTHTQTASMFSSSQSTDRCVH